MRVATTAAHVTVCVGSTWTPTLLQGRARPLLTASRWVACSSSCGQVACQSPDATRRWPQVRGVARLDFVGRGRIATRCTRWSFCLMGPRVRLLVQAREDAESQSTTGDIDKSGVPQSYGPEGGAPWYQITVGAYTMSPKRHSAHASSSRRRCPFHRLFEARRTSAGCSSLTLRHTFHHDIWGKPTMTGPVTQHIFVVNRHRGKSA